MLVDVLGLLIFVIVQGIHVKSDKVLRVTPREERQIGFLRNLKTDAIKKIDFWKAPSQLGNPVDLAISDADYPLLMRLLRQHRLAHVIQIPDVQRLIAQQMNDLPGGGGEGGLSGFHSRFHPLDEIVNKMNATTALYPNRTRIHNLGHSHEGRAMLAIEIRGAQRANKSVFFMECGIHAREWIAPATCMYAIDQLTSMYGQDTSITALLDKMDMMILPVVNVDGYSYTFSKDRMWRKNRRPNPGTRCIGTDLNRNWGYEWGGKGASPVPCDLTYRGPSAFSEPETRNIKAFLESLGPRLQGFADMHSYGQMWFIPWGYTQTKTPDYSEQNRVAGVATKAIANAGYGTFYIHGSSAKLLYVASGGVDDWTYGTLGVKYSFSVELRDTYRYGFLLPPDQIIPTGRETLEGIKALVAAMKI